MGGDRAAAAAGAAPAQGRAAADPGSCGADRDPVRPAHGTAVGVPALGSLEGHVEIEVVAIDEEGAKTAGAVKM